MSGELSVMEAAERPYVGVSEVRTVDENGVPGVVVVLKNFGKSPALNFSAQFKFFVNGNELRPQSAQGPTTPFTFYPGVDQGLRVAFMGKEGRGHWDHVLSGTETLTLHAIRRYGWSTQRGEYQECEERQYDTILKQFRITKQCPVPGEIKK
jgi:hypothetical protein